MTPSEAVQLNVLRVIGKTVAKESPYAAHRVLNGAVWERLWFGWTESIAAAVNMEMRDE